VLISKGEKILHGFNGLFYLMMLAPVYIITKDIYLVAALLVIRRIVFDISLNLFRGLPYNYTSETTTSIIDRLLYKTQNFLGIFYYIILVGIIVLLFVK
jgi:hypothetical protein